MNKQRKHRHIYAGVVLAIVLGTGQSNVIRANSQVTAAPQTTSSGLVVRAGLLWDWLTSSVESLLGSDPVEQTNAAEDDGGGGCPFRICGGGGGSGGNPR